jgi:hypothetical protein
LLSQTFTVGNTHDSGAGSLRDAIHQANADIEGPGVDTIDFNVPTSDPGFNAANHTWTIAPLSALPAIDRPVDINGDSQPGAQPNTLADGDNAVIAIELDGAGAVSAVNGLAIDTSHSAVVGLAINRFVVGIALEGDGDTTVSGDFVGTDPSGTRFRSNVVGIMVNGSANSIGGTMLAARNVISGNTQTGIDLENSSQFGPATGNLIQGNFIGTDATGLHALANFRGIQIGPDSTGNTVGGTTTGARNVISGNTERGVFLTAIALPSDAPKGNLIAGNDIGVDVIGSPALGNGGVGVGLDDALNNTVGGLAAGAANTIAFNGGAGVAVTASARPTTFGNSILSNTIAFNMGLGIDLNHGANTNATAPSVTSALYQADGSSLVQGTITGAPNTTLTLQFFGNDPPAAGLSVQGQNLLGTATVTSDASGSVAFRVILPGPVRAGQVITATATDLAGSTSPFSVGVPAALAPLEDARGHATQLVVTFNLALDPASTGNVSNYQLVPQRLGRLARRARPFPIRRAQYNAATHEVTLIVRGRLPRNRTFVLTIIGVPPRGVQDASDHFLAGDGAHTGTNAVIVIS